MRGRVLDPVSVEGEVSSTVTELAHTSAKAIFIDTDALPARESRAGDLVQNETEAALAHTLASALIDCGIEEKDMAVITPYRQQIKLLTKRFHARKETQSVEILTADKAQGRDKDVIMVSLVRSNEDGNVSYAKNSANDQVGDLLRDWRRINVSFTRAKRKLIIFGSRSTLTSNALLADFISLMDRKGWVLKLPRGAEERHGSAVPVTGDAVDPPGEERVDVKSDGQDPKRGKVSERLLNNRPFVREVLQVG